MKDLKSLLNKEPKEEIIKIITFEDGKEHKYIPIQNLHETADEIFDYWTEDSPTITTTTVGNNRSMCLSITLKLNAYYKDKCISKIGGSSAIVRENNINYITQLLLTESRKNAFAQFGKVFGRDLNREITIEIENNSKQLTPIANKSKEEIRTINFFKSNDKNKIIENLKREEILKIVKNSDELKQILIEKGIDLYEIQKNK